MTTITTFNRPLFSPAIWVLCWIVFVIVGIASHVALVYAVVRLALAFWHAPAIVHLAIDLFLFGWVMFFIGERIARRDSR